MNNIQIFYDLIIYFCSINLTYASPLHVQFAGTAGSLLLLRFLHAGLYVDYLTALGDNSHN